MLKFAGMLKKKLCWGRRGEPGAGVDGAGNTSPMYITVFFRFSYIGNVKSDTTQMSMRIRARAYGTKFCCIFVIWEN